MRLAPAASEAHAAAWQKAALARPPQARRICASRLPLNHRHAALPRRRKGLFHARRASSAPYRVFSSSLSATLAAAISHLFAPRANGAARAHFRMYLMKEGGCTHHALAHLAARAARDRGVTRGLLFHLRKTRGACVCCDSRLSLHAEENSRAPAHQNVKWRRHGDVAIRYSSVWWCGGISVPVTWKVAINLSWRISKSI